MRFAKEWLLLALTSTGLLATPGQDVPSVEYTHAHRLVDVGNGRRLNLFCLGKGSPTVVFEAGGGDESMSYRHIQRRLAEITEVCTYDRAGFGFSDAAARISDAKNIVDDLHRLLTKASIGTPVVLVGHSIGGLYASLYVATYPHEVVGMVLIDPSFVGQDQAITAHWTPAQKTAWGADDTDDISLTRRCLDAARKGSLTPDPACLDSPPDPDALIHRQLDTENASAKKQAALLSEMENSYDLEPGRLSVDETEVRDAHPGFGDMPLVVLTAGKQFMDVTPEQRATARDAWKRGHDNLARMSTRGSSIVVPGASHYIQDDRPDSVVQAIRQVIDDIRNRGLASQADARESYAAHTER